MENIFTAVIVIFIVLFAVLTLSSSFMTAQETMHAAWLAMNERNGDLDQTAITVADLQILNSGSLIEVTLHNIGAVKLTDFDQWDVFAQYYDGEETPIYHLGRLAYSGGSPANNQWALNRISGDLEANANEFYDIGIFNPGEALVLHLSVFPAIGVGQTAQVSVTTINGVTASLVGTRNAPPTLAANTGMRVAQGGSAVVTQQWLAAADTDNDASELIFTVVTPPEQGSLTFPASFTQAQINDGEVVYTHSGAGEDSFAFTVSDGIETIGSFTFPITINTPPVLETSMGLELPEGGQSTITNTLLQVTDEDDLPSNLIYTIVQFPSNGILSLGSTFSQAQIDNNELTYTHTDTDADMFSFVVSDGYDVIGTYTFLITLVVE